MKKQIINVSMFQTSKVIAALYFAVSIPFLVIAALFMMATHTPGMGIGMLLIFPVIYAVCGFIFTLIGAAIYNMVASMVGGIEYTTKEVD
ncbi:MAG: DUF3566 domain-containing protein [Pseudomonadota bacterium]